MRRVLIFAGLALCLLSAFAPVSSAKTKKAEKFGFLPSATAEQNTAALQKCVDGGGVITVSTPGSYKLCGTILLDSNTEIRFGKGVVIERARSSKGVSANHVFLNRGALDRTWNENITLRGLRLKVNGIDGGKDIPGIVGLRGHLAFFYIRNLLLEDIEIPDLEKSRYGIHICTFENAVVSKVRIEGRKDGVHFGTGKGFVVRDGIFKTYDDPIALNAHDYPTSNPELGWIEDGLIENCYDLDDPERGTVGYFARFLGGAWKDWTEGMTIQLNGDAVVSEGRIYRSIYHPVSDSTRVSTCRPVHKSGTVTYPDGLTWVMAQDKNICYNCGVRNVVFRNIHLQKKRRQALSIHFDKSKFSRSYYPYAESPVMDNIVFDKVSVEADIPVLVMSRAPINSFSIQNSSIGSSKIQLVDIETPGIVYDTTHILLKNTTCDDPSKLVMPTSRPFSLENEAKK